MDNIIRVTRSVFTPLRQRLTDLQLGVAYPILAMWNVPSSYGSSVMCHIIARDCRGDENIFSVYLPVRFNGLYSDEDLMAIIPCRLSLTLIRKVRLLNEKETFMVDIDYLHSSNQ